MQSTSRRHRYPPTRRSELLLALPKSRPCVGQDFRDSLGCQRRDIGGRNFNRRIGAEPLDAIPQHMKVIELFATDPLQLLDGSAAVGGVDGLRFLNQRLIQTRAGTFNARRSASLSTRTVAFSPLSACSADFAMPFGGRGARLVIS